MPTEREDGRRAPVQGVWPDHPAGTIAWSEHEQAWLGYRARFPYSGLRQDAERIAERGGFGYDEVTTFLGHEPTTWKPREAR